MRDSVVPFVFDALPVRGALVQLNRAWREMIAPHDYAEPVLAVLGDAAAATALIAQSLKFEGTVTLQVMSDGPLGMLVMQATHELEMRGMARAAGVAAKATFQELIMNARCAVTVDAGAMEQPYQGIVEMQSDSLAGSLENYYARSVQVPSHLQLRSGRAFCGGIILQQMPGEQQVAEDDWRRMAMLIETIRVDELQEGATHELLHKVFAEDDVRVFDHRDVLFHCKCSQNRVEEVLRLLGESETRAACEEKGVVEVTCEYCGQVRKFDAVDVSRVFSEQVGPGSKSLQ